MSIGRPLSNDRGRYAWQCRLTLDGEDGGGMIASACRHELDISPRPKAEEEQWRVGRTSFSFAWISGEVIA